MWAPGHGTDPLATLIALLSTSHPTANHQPPLFEMECQKPSQKVDTGVEQEAVQLSTLVQAAMMRKDVLVMTLQDLILSLVHDGMIDADPLLSAQCPVLHLTAKDPFDQEEWYWKDLWWHQTALCGLCPATITMLCITSETRMILETGVLLVSFVHFIM